MKVTTQATNREELSHGEVETLHCAIGHMIPPSESLGLPGATDAAIFADILQSIGRDLPTLRLALQTITEMAKRPLNAMDSNEQSDLLGQFRTKFPDLAGVLEAVTVRCYYRDDRVMSAIGMEVRPPFPLGFEVPQGDWSLLDPVRMRGKIYRDAD